MRSTFLLPLAIVSSILFFSSCSKNGGGFNLFTIQDDKDLGQMLVAEIDSNPSEYPLLDESQYPQAYEYIRSLRDTVLSSGEVTYKDEFDWDVHIIQDDSTLNAFCAPGGYIYVYTGLIKYLDSEDELLGVMGHEMAHADRRHSTEQLTKAYGISTLFDILLGNNQGTLTDIAQGLIGLSFSRKDESEADEYSVIYLCPTTYNAAGAAGFFQKIEASGASNPPEFLSTHPNPDNRIAAILEKDSILGCSGSATYDARYLQFKNGLP